MQADGDGDGDGDASLGGETGGDGDETGGSPGDGDGDNGSSGGASTGGASTGGDGSGGDNGTPPPNLSDELVLHLKMEEELDATTASDSSGSGNHATEVSGGVSFVDGRFGKAALFEGTGWLEVADDPSLDETSSLTMAAWVRFSDTGGAPGIFSKRVAVSNETAYALFLYTETQTPNMFVDIDAEQLDARFRSTTSFVADEWHHIVAVFDGSQNADARVWIYIDGIFDHEGNEIDTQVGRHSVSTLLIGNLPGGGDVMRGMIDEAALWRRALDPEEVAWIAAHEF